MAAVWSSGSMRTHTSTIFAISICRGDTGPLKPKFAMMKKKPNKFIESMQNYENNENN